LKRGTNSHFLSQAAFLFARGQRGFGMINPTRRYDNENAEEMPGTQSISMASISQPVSLILLLKLLA
jgi:hypothetical protein